MRYTVLAEAVQREAPRTGGRKEEGERRGKQGVGELLYHGAGRGGGRGGAGRGSRGKREAPPFLSGLPSCLPA